MPFNLEAIMELQRREGVSIYKLINELSRFSRERGLEVKFSRPTVYRWFYHGRRPNLEGLDCLYLFAKHKGHNDLEFYKPPEEIPSSAEKQTPRGPLEFIKS